MKLSTIVLLALTAPQIQVMTANDLEHLTAAPPDEFPEWYRAGSPAELAPFGTPQRLMIGKFVVGADRPTLFRCGRGYRR